MQKVRSIPEVKIFNRVSTVNDRIYSGTEFNIKANTSSGIVKFPVDAVWELKYSNSDIIGRPADQSTAAAQGAAGGAGGSGGGGY